MSTRDTTESPAGYKASIIDYANKIEELFAKMEGVRAEVLPPNRQSVDDYFTFGWDTLHTLTATVNQLQPEPGPSTWDKFKSYLEAEEARLNTNLTAVDYVIDGTDTLTLITGTGRIEKVGLRQYIYPTTHINNVLKTVFPLIYLLVKRHYEIMRVMRTKVLDNRELLYGIESIRYAKDAIQYRMNDLTSTSSPISLVDLYHLPRPLTQTYFLNKNLTLKNNFRISLMALCVILVFTHSPTF